MARNYEDERRNRDYMPEDRFLKERDWSRRDWRSGPEAYDEYDEYNAAGRERDWNREQDWDRDYKRRDYGSFERPYRDWDRRSWESRSDRDYTPSESASAGQYTSGWNTQGYTGWSSQTGHERRGFGGPWGYGRSFGSDYMYGRHLGEENAWPGEGRESESSWNRGITGRDNTWSWGEGQYSGRGPRGWRRADTRIEDEVHERLSRHGYLDASDIQVEVKDCEVTLKGHVRSKEEKRLAEDVVETVFGVEDVHNKLKVEKHDDDRDWDKDRGEYEKRAIEGHEQTVKRILNANP
jgi:hypothetical protein